MRSDSKLRFVHLCLWSCQANICARTETRHLHVWPWLSFLRTCKTFGSCLITIRKWQLKVWSVFGGESSNNICSATGNCKVLSLKMLPTPFYISHFSCKPFGNSHTIFTLPVHTWPWIWSLCLASYYFTFEYDDEIFEKTNPRFMTHEVVIFITWSVTRPATIFILFSQVVLHF
jgi:hypothetical protein